jgi:hypothetical protein
MFETSNCPILGNILMSTESAKAAVCPDTKSTQVKGTRTSGQEDISNIQALFLVDEQSNKVTKP